MNVNVSGWGETMEVIARNASALKGWYPPRGTDGRAEADAAVAGSLLFKFNGVREVPIGRRGIDWAGSHVQHQEWRCQLHRFFCLPHLVQAFEETGDACYVEAARDLIEDWMEAFPVQGGEWEMRCHKTLDLSIRVGNSRFAGWLPTLIAFAGQKGFADEAFQERVVESIRAQVRYLEGHLTVMGNWRLCEADTLITAGLILSMFEESSRWVKLGVEVINEGFLKQILPDGAHYELTPGYHHWMNNLFGSYWRLGRLRPDLGLTIPTERLLGMFEYGLATYRPDGAFNAWNDSQATATHPFESFRNAYEAFCHEAGLPPELPRKGFFPWAQQAALRDGWEEESWYLTLDGAAGAGTHSHLGRNGLQLMAYGAPLVVDPGYLSYEATEPSMALGRATRAHNTVNLNGWNQSFSPCRSFRHLEGERASMLVSQYDGGYWDGECDWRFTNGLKRGISAFHHRTVLWMREIGVFVIDHLVREYTGRPETEVPHFECNWQFATTEVELDRENQRVRTRQPKGNVLMLLPSWGVEDSLTLYSGSEAPLRGWLPGNNGLDPAGQVCLSRPLPGRFVECVTLLLPFKGDQEPEVRCRLWRPDPNGVSQFLLEWGDGTTDEITWSHRLVQPIGRCGFSTDAPFVWQRKRSGAAPAVVHFGSRFEESDAEGHPGAGPVEALNFWSLAAS